MASKLDAVCTALTALWTTTFASSAMRVVDGPQVNADPTVEWLFVGFDGDEPDAGNEGASIEQEWLAFNKVKQETGEITCAVVAVNGGVVDTPAVRARALAVVDDCEDAVRADPLLGGLVMQASVTVGQHFPSVTQAGSKARVVFTVTYQAQI